MVIDIKKLSQIVAYILEVRKETTHSTSELGDEEIQISAKRLQITLENPEIQVLKSLSYESCLALAILESGTVENLVAAVKYIAALAVLKPNLDCGRLVEGISHISPQTLVEIKNSLEAPLDTPEQLLQTEIAKLE